MSFAPILHVWHHDGHERGVIQKSRKCGYRKHHFYEKAFLRFRFPENQIKKSVNNPGFANHISDQEEHNND